MVEQLTQRLDATFHALSDTTRRAMLHSLAGGKQTVSELAAPHAMSLAAASKHIKVLEAAGLIRREVVGRTHIVHLDTAAMAEANAWMRFYERFWSNRLDALETMLVREDEAEEAKP